jgi:hypothetical protein
MSVRPAAKTWALETELFASTIVTSMDANPLGRQLAVVVNQK